MHHRRIVGMLCCVTVLAACSSTPMRRNLKEAWRDGVIKADVKMQLVSNQEIKARYVNVDVFRGVVSLSGRVESPTQRQLAEELSRQTNEVVLVENHLVVRSPNDPRFMPIDGADMEADAVAVRTVSVDVPLQVPTTARTQNYSDLAVGDPFAGKPLPVMAPRIVEKPVQVAIPMRILQSAPPPPPRAPVSPPRAITTPDRTYSDLAVGDPLSPGRRPVAPRAVATAKPPASASPPANVAPRVSSTPAPVQPVPRTVQAPRYLDKGVIPPAASVDKRVIAPVPSLTATQEATRTPMIKSGAVDAGLAQEAAEELRRLKSATE